MQASIRTITPSDIESCGRICYEGFKSVNERHGFPAQFPSIGAGIERVRRMHTSPSTSGIVAEREGSIAGFAFLTQRDAVNAIGPIVVDPSIQTRGLGRSLMEALLEMARGADSIRLVQAGFNMQSLALYAALGFEVRDQLIVMSGRAPQNSATSHAIRKLEEGDVAECEALQMRVLGYSRVNELRDRVAEGCAIVACGDGRIQAYLASPSRVAENHGIAGNTEALQAILCGASALTDTAVSILLPAKQTDMLRWCLRAGMRASMPMTLMSMGAYMEPKAIALPSILY